ncbi:MAG: hypothetical protein J0M04_01050 [Verrucomicrobia bacterium]|nr:hypothetical protein [Verrucomicrobiota bacterium]
MKPSINLILAAAATLFVVSCYPYPENTPKHRHKPNPEAVTKEAEEKAKADELKKKEEAKLKEEEAKNKDKEGDKIKTPDGSASGGDEFPPPNKPPVVDKPTYEVAKKAPGKDGFVLSPYNNKLIDVRGIAPGTLVRDPTYPPSEKKYFRVP